MASYCSLFFMERKDSGAIIGRDIDLVIFKSGIGNPKTAAG